MTPNTIKNDNRFIDLASVTMFLNDISSFYPSLSVQIRSHNIYSIWSFNFFHVCLALGIIAGARKIWCTTRKLTFHLDCLSYQAKKRNRENYQAIDIPIWWRVVVPFEATRINSKRYGFSSWIQNQYWTKNDPRRQSCSGTFFYSYFFFDATKRIPMSEIVRKKSNVFFDGRTNL